MLDWLVSIVGMLGSTQEKLDCKLGLWGNTANVEGLGGCERGEIKRRKKLRFNNVPVERRPLHRLHSFRLRIPIRSCHFLGRMPEKNLLHRPQD